MKTITKASIYLPMAAMLLALALAGPSTAAAQVPFSGTVQGHEKDDIQGNPPQKILIDGSLTGVAIQFGLITITYKGTVNLNSPVGGTASGQLTTANGDIISTAIVGAGQPVPGSPTLNTIVEIHAITGGTGQFAGATGIFVLKRLIDLATGQTSGSFRGTITSKHIEN